MLSHIYKRTKMLRLANVTRDHWGWLQTQNLAIISGQLWTNDQPHCARITTLNSLEFKHALVAQWSKTFQVLRAHTPGQRYCVQDPTAWYPYQTVTDTHHAPCSLLYLKKTTVFTTRTWTGAPRCKHCHQGQIRVNNISTIRFGKILKCHSSVCCTYCEPHLAGTIEKITLGSSLGPIWGSKKVYSDFFTRAAPPHGGNLQYLTRPSKLSTQYVFLLQQSNAMQGELFEKCKILCNITFFYGTCKWLHWLGTCPLVTPRVKLHWIWICSACKSYISMPWSMPWYSKYYLMCNKWSSSSHRMSNASPRRPMTFTLYPAPWSSFSPGHLGYTIKYVRKFWTNLSVSVSCWWRLIILSPVPAIMMEHYLQWDNILSVHHILDLHALYMRAGQTGTERCKG